MSFKVDCVFYNSSNYRRHNIALNRFVNLQHLIDVQGEIDNGLGTVLGFVDAGDGVWLYKIE